MTILDDILGGFKPSRFIAKAATNTTVAGRWYSTWAVAGIPGAGSYDTTLAGVALSSSSTMVAGQIPHTDPVSGTAKLARWVGAMSQAGTLMLCDRLWHNGGMSITSTSSQTITSATFPARDNAGTTNGDGVLIGVEVSAATGAGTPTLTLGYTNQAGTSSRSSTNLIATGGSSVAQTFYPLGLQAGDGGVRSIQSIQLSATWTSGTINLVAYRVMSVIECPIGNAPNGLDYLTGGGPTIFNGSVPFVIISASSAANISSWGHYQEVHI